MTTEVGNTIILEVKIVKMTDVAALINAVACVEDAVIEGLRKRGFAGNLRCEGDWLVAWTSCMDDLFASLGARRPEINAVLVVDERFDHKMVTPLLAKLGLSDDVRLVGVGLQNVQALVGRFVLPRTL